MAKLLLDGLEPDGCPKKKVIPFLVGKKNSLKNASQVEFMIKHCWLREQNVLSWDAIKRLQE